MHRWVTLAIAIAALTAVGCSLGCSSKKGGAPSTAGEATPIGTPRPGFEGPIPKGALTVKDGEVGRYGGRLVLSIAGNPSTFNPMLANDVPTNRVLHGKVYESCLRFKNDTHEMVPSLCEGFERGADGLSYTFTLREGLTWSDGKPLTSEDFAFTYKVLLDPKVVTSTTDLFRQGVDAAGKARFPTLEVLDGRRFKFTLHTPDVLFHVNVASMHPIPKHAWGKAYAEGRFNEVMRLSEPPENMPVSGPYRIHSIAAGERVVLVRNPRYWKVDSAGNRLPYLDKIIFSVVRDFNAQFVRFKDNEIDAIEVRPEHYDALKREEPRGDFKLHDLGPALSTYYLMFNLDRRTKKDGTPYVDPIKLGWFDSVEFRKAVSHAIDRVGIVRTVMAGRGTPIHSYYSPGNKKWFNPDTVTYPYDLDKARALLTQGGFVVKDGTLHDSGGHPVEFSVTTNSENATRIAMLNVIKDDLAKLGMTVHLRPVPFNEVTSAMRNGRNFDAILLGWGSAVPPDPAQSKNVLLSSGASHAWDPLQDSPHRPWEKAIDDALYANIASSDFPTRKRHMDRILAIWADKLPQIMLVVPNQFVAGRSFLGNFKPSALRPMLSWNVDQLFLSRPRAR